LSALSGGVPASQEAAVLTMLGAAAEWVVAVVVLVLVAVTLLAATVVSVLRNASLPRDDRLVGVVERLERHYPVLRQFDASEMVEPTAEDRKRDLRERYVAGELGEAEFERKLAAIMDETSADDRPRTDERTNVELEEDRSR
jgi:uncharacterized membrane protein